jgi:hypothetical protein
MAELIFFASKYGVCEVGLIDTTSIADLRYRTNRQALESGRFGQ